MVHVSVETPEQTVLRLERVLRAASLDVIPGAYAFLEGRGAAVTVLPDALAMVRDRESWSQLVPASQAPGVSERFRIFSFHFAADLDNSGFVGWLASALKAQLGTGVVVICGQNGRRGGIYDYWGVPEALGDAAVKHVRALRERAT